MRPTRTSTLAIVAVACAAVSWLLLKAIYSKHLPLVPWTGVPALLVAALAEAGPAVTLRPGSPAWRGLKPAAPLFVSRMVALAKASSLAAAVIAGLALGFVIYLSGSLSETIPRQDAVIAAVTFAAAVVLACAALYLEVLLPRPRRPGPRPERRASPAVLSSGEPNRPMPWSRTAVRYP